MRGAILGRNCRVGRSVTSSTGACSATNRVTDYSTAIDRHAMTLNPGIFKAYDVRGTLSRGDQRRRGARPIGRGFVAYLGAEAHRGRRATCGCRRRRSRRRSSTARRAQGADVVDYGMLATDMMYFAVASDDLDGGAQITASHNPKQYNGIKMVRREALPL